MRTKTYQVKLLCPTFLGAADQAGAWRVPPFKATIREWWRVATAAVNRIDVATLRCQEQRVFGVAANSAGGKSEASKLRMSLGQWRQGTMIQWPRTRGPQLQTGQGRGLTAEFYLGFGPVKAGPALTYGRALNDTEENTLKLSWPESHSDELRIDSVIPLVHYFATIGGRSRNAWGSLVLRERNAAPFPELTHDQLAAAGVLNDLDDCLQCDWPHAIGTDIRGPLVWHSAASFGSWREAMGVLAEVRWNMRRVAKERGVARARTVQPLDAIVAPTTGQTDFSPNNRVANTLRFKLYRGDDERIRARIFHMPCLPPVDIDRSQLAEAWRAIHKKLDCNTTLQRIS